MSYFKNLFKKKVPSTPQTQEISLLHNEHATHPSKGLTPQQLAEILTRAEYGDLVSQAELFMDMEEKDGHIQAEMHKRKMAVVGLDWQLQPPRNATDAEKKATAELEDRIRDKLDVEDMIFDALDAIGHGYSCLELDWEKEAIGWFPQVRHRTPRWFTLDPKNPEHVRLRVPEHIYGNELIPFGWIEHQHKSRSGTLSRTGLHRSLVWSYLFKNYSLGDLAEMLEIYGMPIRIGKYGPGATAKEKKTLMGAIQSIGHNAGGIMPDTMSMEFIAATSSASSDPFKVMIDWAEAIQSKVILGNALSTMDSRGGSQALGVVHNGVRLEIRNSDARQLANSLSKFLVQSIAMLNGLFAEGRCPRWQFDTNESEDLALFADALPKLSAAGAQIPVRYVNEKLKIPVPEKGEAILGGSPINNSMAALKSKGQKFTPEQQALENIADAMPSHSPINGEQIASAIRAATSPEDLEVRLSVLLDSSDLTQFSQTLEKVLFAADVMGYADA